MREYINAFAAEFDYPDDAKTALVSAYDRIERVFDNSLFKSVEKYEKGELSDIAGALNTVRDEAELLGVNRFTSGLLFFVCLSKHLKQMYADAGLDEALWHDSMTDLKAKLIECHTVRGIWGSFVCEWFIPFFKLDRFTLGRLQFERQAFRFGKYEGYGIALDKNSIILSVHVPSGGRLDHEACLDSYRRAYEFFSGELFGGGNIIVQCESWLLYPPILEFLPESCRNIRNYHLDFDIFDRIVTPDFVDAWRLYNVDYWGNPKSLPRTNSLYRAYADWLELGNLAGEGVGILIFDGKSVITRKAPEC